MQIVGCSIACGRCRYSDDVTILFMHCKSMHRCLNDEGVRPNRVSTLSVVNIRTFRELTCSLAWVEYLSYISCQVDTGRHGRMVALVHITKGVSNNGMTRMQPSSVTTRRCRALIELKTKLMRRTFRVKSAISRSIDT